jgi:preprotein translocase subunit SecF
VGTTVFADRVAWFHDVLIVVGIFSILDLISSGLKQADSLFIVALLTIVGFSVNDTAVITSGARVPTAGPITY